MTRRTLLVLALLLGITFGLAFEPDSGTQASVGAPDVHGLVLGANHAKPLPQVASVRQLLSIAGIGLAMALAVLIVADPRWAVATQVSADRRHRSVFRSPARARRGPPAFA
jgi:hypothetical protein